MVHESPKAWQKNGEANAPNVHSHLFVHVVPYCYFLLSLWLLLYTVQQVADDIETYKTMLWVQSEIDKSVDCRDPKQKLYGTTTDDPSYPDVLLEYKLCFAAGLYYYNHRLPFLKEGMKSGNFDADEIIFRERLAELEIKHKYVEEAQKRLGFPEPSELPKN